MLNFNQVLGRGVLAFVALGVAFAVSAAQLETPGNSATEPAALAMTNDLADGSLGGAGSVFVPGTAPLLIPELTLTDPSSQGDTQILYASLSPGGQRILSVTRSTVRIWDAVTGAEIAVLAADRLPRVEGQSERFAFAAVSSDGRRALTVSAFPDPRATSQFFLPDSLMHTLHLWDVDTGTPLLSLGTHSGSATFSPDGSLVAVAWDRPFSPNEIPADRVLARIWDVDAGILLALMQDPGMDTYEQVHALVFSPDGRTVATLSRQITPCRTEQPCTGNYLNGTSSAGVLRLWDALTGAPIGVLDHGPDFIPVSATFSADGQRVVTAASNEPIGTGRSLVQVWDVATGNPLATPLAFGGGNIRFAGFQADERHIRALSQSSGSQALLWDTAITDEQPVAMLTDSRLSHTTRKFHSGASVSVDGRLVTWNATQVHLWNLAEMNRQTSGPVALIGTETPYLHGPRADGPFSSNTNNVIFSPNGELAVSRDSDGVVYVWNPSTGDTISVLADGSSIPQEDLVSQQFRSAAFSPDGQHIATTSSRVLVNLSSEGPGTIQQHILQVWDVATGDPLLAISSEDVPLLQANHAVFSPDGQRIVTATTGSPAHPTLIQLWSALTGNLLLEMQASALTANRSAHSLSISPDGGRVIAAVTDGTVRVWDAVSGRELLVLENSSGGSGSSIAAAALSLDGQRILGAYVTGGLQAVTGIAHVWTLSGELLATHHIALGNRTAESLRWAAFSPDGQRILLATQGSASIPSSIWDAGTGERLFFLPLVSGFARIENLLFLPDGRLLGGYYDFDPTALQFKLPLPSSSGQ